MTESLSFLDNVILEYVKGDTDVTEHPIEQTGSMFSKIQNLFGGARNRRQRHGFSHTEALESRLVPSGMTLDPAVLDALVAAHLSIENTGTPAEVSALQKAIEALPSANDLQTQIHAVDLHTVSLQTELGVTEKERDTAKITRDTLLAAPVMTTEKVTTLIPVNFSAVSAGNKANGTKIALPEAGTVKVESGGFTPVSVTAEGTIRTGENQGHLILSFLTPTEVESVTVRQVSGSGKSLLNLGDGYIRLSGGTEVIPVGRTISNIIIVVYQSSMYEVVSFTVRTEQTKQIPSPTYRATLATAEKTLTDVQVHLDDLQKRIDDDLRTKTSLVTTAKKQQILTERLAAAQSEVAKATIEAEVAKATSALQEAIKIATVQTPSGPSVLSFQRVKDGVLPEKIELDIGSDVHVKVLTSDARGVTVKQGIVSSGPNGMDHLIVQFVGGSRLVRELRMHTFTSATGGKIGFSLGDTNTYMELPVSGILHFETPIETEQISFIARGGQGAGMESITVEPKSEIVEAPKPHWQESSNWMQTLINRKENVYVSAEGQSTDADFRVTSFNPNAGQFHRYEFGSTGASLEFVGVGYIGENGVSQVPSEFVTVLPNGNGCIIKPNAPMSLVFNVHFTDGRHGGGAYSVRVAQSGVTEADVVGVPGVKLVAGAIQIRRDERTEGFGQPILEVTSGVTPQMAAGHIMNIMWGIRNVGDGSAGQTLRLRAGFTGTSADGLLREIATSFRGFETKTLSTNIVVPGDPQSDPQHPRRPLITLLRVNQDGTEEVIGQVAGTLPFQGPKSTMDIRAETQARATALASLPMYGPDGVTVVGMGGGISPKIASTDTQFDVPIEGVSIEMNKSSIEIVEKPNSKNTMIVVIYGSNQFPEQVDSIGKSIIGFDKLVVNLRKEYKEVWPVSPGENPSVGIRGLVSDFHVEATDQLQTIENLISSRVKNNSEIKFIVLGGYSWGGGDVYKIAEWISGNKLLRLQIAGTFYVDAIKTPNETLLTYEPENRLPIGTMAMLNLYESQSKKTIQDPIGMHGSEIISAIPQMREISQTDYDISGDTLNHGNIDEHSVDTIVNFIHRQVKISL